MKITIEVFPAKIVDGEDVPIGDDHFSEEQLTDMVYRLIDKEYEEKLDSGEDFEFICTRPRVEL